MNEQPAWLAEREQTIRAFFGLAPATELIAPAAWADFAVPPAVAAQLAQFKLEWHLIPAETAVSIETAAYRERLYPGLRLDPQRDYRRTVSYQAITRNHRQHQGRLVALETTMKPRYLPGNRQFYGTPYGFNERADPLLPYLSRATFLSSTQHIHGTRYGHNYASLCQLVQLINEDWRAQGLLLPGYRLTICPPVLFNLIGTLFHREWSETESLELGFYRDAHENAKCYAVGADGPGDFSYIREIASEADWTLLGFRLALVPV